MLILERGGEECRLATNGGDQMIAGLSDNALLVTVALL